MESSPDSPAARRHSPETKAAGVRMVRASRFESGAEQAAELAGRVTDHLPLAHRDDEARFAADSSRSHRLGRLRARLIQGPPCPRRRQHLLYVQTLAVVLPFVMAYNANAALEVSRRTANAPGSTTAIDVRQGPQDKHGASRSSRDYGFDERDIGDAVDRTPWRGTAPMR